MQGPDPVGILFGDYNIQKWRNLRKAEHPMLHGVLTGDKRNGPVRVAIFVRAPAAALSAARAALAKAEGVV